MTTMVLTAGLERSWLLDTPVEVKLEVVNYLDRKRDLYNLSRACRTLEDMVIARLYKVVNFEIPQKKGSSWVVGGMPRFRPHVVQSIQTFRVQNGPLDVSHPVYSKRRKSDAGSVDVYVCDVVNKIPSNQLRTFAYLHTTPMSIRMLKTLHLQHDTGLQELSLYELDSTLGVPTFIPCNLRKLECRSVLEGDVIYELIKANSSTLEQLTLGQERDLVKQYQTSRIGFLDRLQQPYFFTSSISLANLPRLRELHLCGLNVAALIPTNDSVAASFCNLESLSVESCAHTAELLSSLAAIFHFFQQSASVPTPRIVPKLTSFALRHEAPTNGLKEALLLFLSSFSGLSNISILIENGAFLEGPSALISGHGATIRSLVLECRVQPRISLAMDTSRPFGGGGYRSDLWHETMNDISELCPSLTELSIGFPWNDEMVRLRRNRLPRSLKTMHIRNFPESKTLWQLGDYTVKEYATKFVEWVVPSCKDDEQPELEELAIGPTLYGHRWKTANSGEAELPQFLRAHYFCVDWTRTRLGKWGAVLSEVGEKYMEEMRGQRPLEGVFKPVWLT